jgi:hypothetical protein
MMRFHTTQESGRAYVIWAATSAGVACRVVSGAAPSSAEHGPPAPAKAETHLVCLNGDGSEYRRKDRPKQRAIYGRGGIFAGGVNLKKLKWRSWGHARAKAKGIECGFHLPCADITAKVRAWRPRERYGKRVYTRLKATTRFGHSRANAQGCPGPAF